MVRTQQTLIVEREITRLVAEGRELLAAVVESEQAAAVRRMEMGRFLLKARSVLPKRGSREDGWGHFLEAIEVDEATAYRYMKLAEATVGFTEKDKDRIPTYTDLGLTKRESPQLPDAPPPSDNDAPVAMLDHDPPQVDRVEVKGLRDGWCTADDITALLPEVDLDPCSNERSTVRARNTYSLERGENGLELPWFGMMYINGPFSDLEPWADRLLALRAEILGFGFMVNADHSTGWWRTVVAAGAKYRLDFTERLMFKPPPGVVPSKNDRPQSLLMDEVFLASCQPGLFDMGQLWEMKQR